MAENPKIKVIGFETKYVRQVDGTLKPVDWVSYSPGRFESPSVTKKRVKDMIPTPTDQFEDRGPNSNMRQMHMEARWSVIGPAYEAWKKGMEIPETGTPIVAWAGVSREQAELLKKVGILTVEDFTNVEDNKLNRIPLPNARSLRDAARRFLSGADNSLLAAKMTEMEAQNAAMKEQLDAAMALLEEQADAQKRKPGRPRKEPVEEAEAA